MNKKSVPQKNYTESEVEEIISSVVKPYAEEIFWLEGQVKFYKEHLDVYERAVAKQKKPIVKKAFGYVPMLPKDYDDFLKNLKPKNKPGRSPIPYEVAWEFLNFIESWKIKLKLEDDIAFKTDKGLLDYVYKNDPYIKKLPRTQRDEQAQKQMLRKIKKAREITGILQRTSKKP